MHTGIPRKTLSPSSPSAFKPVLNTKSTTTSTSSRLPTSRLPTSNKKSASSSSRSFKENIPPVASNSKKQGSNRSTTLEKSSNGADEPKIEKKNNNKGDGLEDVQSVGSKHKDGEKELSFTHPVLADSVIVVANENSRADFDYNVDREYDINLKLESSFYETRLAARHNDSIEVTLKRTQARFLCRMSRAVNDEDEASISLEYIIGDDDDEEADDTFDLSDFLSKNAPPSAPPTAPLPPLPTVPVTTEQADDTFDLSDFLDKNTPILGEDRLLDTSLSDLMRVEIDYDREFPNTAIGRPPHIFVCRYKRDMKRKAAAQKALGDQEQKPSTEKEGNRCVLDNEYIIDLPLQSWAPTFSANVLSPEKSKLEAVVPPSIPSLIVTSPSDGDIVCVPDREPPVFDEKVIEYGVHKSFLLDASYHNWCLRFGMPLPDADELDEDRYEDEVEGKMDASIPSLIVTSPSDGDVVCMPDREPPEFDEKMIEYGMHKYFLLDASYHNWCLRFGAPLSNDEDEDEEGQRGSVNVPRIIITDTDPILERLRLEFGEEGPLDEIY
ncbi:hypothetical protein APHAL10511_000366 [Amanita phalloides]|nr:hypothetical protein APHAL10511_000366 [Amanita phalloides]